LCQSPSPPVSCILTPSSYATYNIQVSKLAIEIASAIAIVRDRRTPSIGVWVAISNVSGYIPAWKVPHFDAGACPQAGVHAAAVGVECSAVGCANVRDDATPVVSTACTAVCVFDATASFAAGTDVRGAAGGCMERDLVVRIQMNTFVDVWGAC
jgi:hypothetical protein